MNRAWRLAALTVILLGLAGACGFDTELREYLSVRFWMPFSKHIGELEKPGIKRIDTAFAGMGDTQPDTPLAHLRTAYQELRFPLDQAFSTARQQPFVTAARASANLTPRDREEIDLIDAKIEMRSGTKEAPDALLRAKTKLQAFLQTAKTPEWQSEARGWLAHVHYELGDDTAAGKIYLDELNRPGSNLSRETILDSLHMVYGYDGGQQLVDHLDQYFDTPEHATFAIQLATNPRSWEVREQMVMARLKPAYPKILQLLATHRNLFRTGASSSTLTLLSMRVALRMGDPPGMLKIAALAPAAAPVRSVPDYLWMTGSAHFLTGNYAAAQTPLLALFAGRPSGDSQKAAAAYALCGVYQKLGNTVEQIRFAVWLLSETRRLRNYFSGLSSVTDQSIYWANSGMDAGLLLDAQARPEDIEAYLAQYLDAPGTAIAKYALAVRYARAARFTEAAALYTSIQQTRRAERMQTLATLSAATMQPDATPTDLLIAKVSLAEYIASNSDRLFFNADIWNGFQTSALAAARDSRLTAEERKNWLVLERQLQDEQEERWRAYEILHEVIDSKDIIPDLRHRAARIALQSLAGISTRFGRSADLARAQAEMSRALRN